MLNSEQLLSLYHSMRKTYNVCVSHILNTYTIYPIGYAPRGFVAWAVGHSTVISTWCINWLSDYS